MRLHSILKLYRLKILAILIPSSQTRTGSTIPGHLSLSLTAAPTSSRFNSLVHTLRRLAAILPRMVSLTSLNAHVIQ